MANRTTQEFLQEVTAGKHGDNAQFSLKALREIPEDVMVFVDDLLDAAISYGSARTLEGQASASITPHLW